MVMEYYTLDPQARTVPHAHVSFLNLSISIFFSFLNFLPTTSNSKIHAIRPSSRTIFPSVAGPHLSQAVPHLPCLFPSSSHPLGRGRRGTAARIGHPGQGWQGMAVVLRGGATGSCGGAVRVDAAARVGILAREGRRKRK